MNLGKLLGSGKSFFGGKGTVTYRENKQVYLPTFNTDRNPFAPKAVEPQPEASAPAVVVTEAPKPQRVPTSPVPVAVPVPGPARSVNWAEKLNPFRSAKPATAAPTVPMPNLQSEFSLNGVKVVHNDLSDADVEVVPMKSRSATPTMVVAALPFSCSHLRTSPISMQRQMKWPATDIIL
jgi:hypothetical protein